MAEGLITMNFRSDAHVVGSINNRVARLALIACARRHWWKWNGPQKEQIATAEEYADGNRTAQQLEMARLIANRPVFPGTNTVPFTRRCFCKDDSLYHHLLEVAGKDTSCRELIDDEFVGPCELSVPLVQTRTPVALCGSILGGSIPMAMLPNGLFTPAFTCAWFTADAVTIARNTYAEKRYEDGAMDLAQIAVLADAIEEAGCYQHPLLSHLRRRRDHYRGCWALDLILGKRSTPTNGAI
jgi:hypothetical protein